MKIPPTHFREIDFVVVDELPVIQQELLKSSTNLEYIKILIDGKIIGPCLQYKHYELWFHQVYKREQTQIQQKEVKEISFQLKSI